MSDYKNRKNGISSDDPEAIVKLEAKLEVLQAEQAEMKNANAYYRKHKTMKGYPGLSDFDACRIDEKISKGYSWEQQPHPGYRLTNNNANIRRITKRIAELKKLGEMFTKDSGDNDETTDATDKNGWAFDGGTVEMNTELNRIQIFFDAKPDENIRSELKGRGFKWAPSKGAWQRQLNANGLYAVRQIKCIQAERKDDCV